MDITVSWMLYTPLSGIFSVLCLLENYLLTFKESSLVLRAWNQRPKSVTTSVPGQSSEPLFGCPDTVLWCETPTALELCITDSRFIRKQRQMRGSEGTEESSPWLWTSLGDSVLETQECAVLLSAPCDRSLEHQARWTWTRESGFGNIQNGGNTNQAGQDPIALCLYKFSSRSGPSSSLHLVITKANSHIKTFERKLPEKFRAGVNNYSTYNTTKRPGLLNLHFSSERLDHSP